MKFSSILSIAAVAGLASATPAPADLPTAVKVPLSAARLAELESYVTNSTIDGALDSRATKCYYTAYNDNKCNNGVGAIIEIKDYGMCIRTQGRHSFYVSEGCGKLNHLFWTKLSCQGNYSGQKFGAGCFASKNGVNWAASYVSRS